MRITIITIVIALLVVGVCNVPSLYADLLWDGGYHEFSEGFEGEIDMINGATADITGGEIGILLCWDTSEVFVYVPSEIDLLRPSDFSTANVYGGTIDYLFTLGSSSTSIYGGVFDEIQAKDLSTLTFYVDSVQWDPIGGTRDGGLLTGIWRDSSESFTINLVTEETINHVNFIPEPSTISLLMIGTLIFRRSVRKK